MNFTISGTIDATPRTISWDEELGFLDPSRKTEELIRTRAVVSLTPTGPHFTADATKEDAAFVTALNCFDSRGESMTLDEGAQHIADTLLASAPIPPEAIA